MKFSCNRSVANVQPLASSIHTYYKPVGRAMAGVAGTGSTGGTPAEGSDDRTPAPGGVEPMAAVKEETAELKLPARPACSDATKLKIGKLLWSMDTFAGINVADLSHVRCVPAGSALAHVSELERTGKSNQVRVFDVTTGEIHFGIDVENFRKSEEPACVVRSDGTVVISSDDIFMTADLAAKTSEKPLPWTHKWINPSDDVWHGMRCCLDAGGTTLLNPGHSLGVRRIDLDAGSVDWVKPETVTSNVMDPRDSDEFLEERKQRKVAAIDPKHDELSTTYYRHVMQLDDGRLAGISNGFCRGLHVWSKDCTHVECLWYYSMFQHTGSSKSLQHDPKAAPMFPAQCGPSTVVVCHHVPRFNGMTLVDVDSMKVLAFLADGHHILQAVPVRIRGSDRAALITRTISLSCIQVWVPVSAKEGWYKLQQEVDLKTDYATAMAVLASGHVLVGGRGIGVQCYELHGLCAE